MKIRRIRYILLVMWGVFSLELLNLHNRGSPQFRALALAILAVALGIYYLWVIDPEKGRAPKWDLSRAVLPPSFIGVSWAGYWVEVLYGLLALLLGVILIHLIKTRIKSG